MAGRNLTRNVPLQRQTIAKELHVGRSQRTVACESLHISTDIPTIPASPQIRLTSIFTVLYILSPRNSCQAEAAFPAFPARLTSTEVKASWS